MFQMGRQNKKCFHKRYGQNANHGLGHYGDKFSHNPFNVQQGSKGHNGCGHCHDNRSPYLFHTVKNSLFWGFAHGIMGVDIFSHYYGIIHQYPQGHDKPEQRKHINGGTQVIQDQKRPHKGDWNSRCNPEGKAQIQKQCQHDKHQQNSLQSVFKQKINTSLDHICHIKPVSKGYISRHLVLVFFNIFYGCV